MGETKKKHEPQGPPDETALELKIAKAETRNVVYKYNQKQFSTPQKTIQTNAAQKTIGEFGQENISDKKSPTRN